MPRVSHQVEVSVNDQGSIDSQRVIEVVIKASSELFLLSDLLSKEGALKNLEHVVRASSKAATTGYIESGRKLLRGLNKGRGKKRGGD